MGEKKMSMQEMEKLPLVRKKVGVEKGKEKKVGVEANGKKATVGAELEGIVYPAPLYSHEQVVRFPAEIFLWTLQYFHFFMCTEFKVPVIGGKRLDLRLLYVEVTQRGGVEQVTREKRWGEVGATFKFPSTATNASFVLRKYYLILLYHFEKVYFFRTQGPPVPPPASLQIKRQMSKHASSLKISDSTTRGPKSRKRAHPTSQSDSTSQNDGLQNFSATGTIDSKFECGYIVTVNIGSEVMHGVLFNTKQLSSAPSSLTAEAPSGAIATQATATEKRCKQRSGQRPRGPTRPRPRRSAYNFFVAEKYSKLRALSPDQDLEFSKMIGEAWNKLSKEERSVHKDRRLNDKERYKREMREYRERLKVMQPREAVMAKTSKGKAVGGK